MTKFSESDMRAILRHRCDAAGGQAMWAAANGVSPQFTSDVLNGRRAVSENIARILGYRREVCFSSCNPPESVAKQ